MREDNKSGLARRDFLRALAAGAGLAAIATAALTGEAAATETPAEAKKKRYNPNAEDVKNYYRVNRY
jgi:sugar (pentulose or hexulose) kinase